MEGTEKDKKIGQRVIFYTAHCSKCNILEQKLRQKNIEYEVYDDLDGMLAKGFKNAPMLEVDGTVYNFGQAVKWVNTIEG